MSLALRGPAAAAFIIQMLQHDTELIQPLVNTATRGPVPQTFTQLVLISESNDPLSEKWGREIGGDNVITFDTSLFSTINTLSAITRWLLVYPETEQDATNCY